MHSHTNFAGCLATAMNMCFVWMDGWWYVVQCFFKKGGRKLLPRALEWKGRKIAGRCYSLKLKFNVYLFCNDKLSFFKSKIHAKYTREKKGWYLFVGDRVWAEVAKLEYSTRKDGFLF